MTAMASIFAVVTLPLFSSFGLEFFVDGVSDRVHTMGTAFLGLTMECSKCHDHKYDPITAKDYYQLFSFFNSINENGLYIHGNISPPPSLLLPNDAQEAELKKRKQRVAAAQQKLAQLDKDLGPKFQEWKTTLLPDDQLSLADQTGLFDFNKDQKKPLESRIQPPTGPENKDKNGKVIKPKPPSLSLADIHYTEGPKSHGSAIILDGDHQHPGVDGDSHEHGGRRAMANGVVESLAGGEVEVVAVLRVEVAMGQLVRNLDSQSDA
jgi:hypothetical protein